MITEKVRNFGENKFFVILLLIFRESRFNDTDDHFQSFDPTLFSPFVEVILPKGAFQEIDQNLG